MSEVELVKRLQGLGIEREARETIERLLKQVEYMQDQTKREREAQHKQFHRAEAAEAQVAALKALLASAKKFASDYMTEEWAKAARKALEASR